MSGSLNSNSTGSGGAIPPSPLVLLSVLFSTQVPVIGSKSMPIAAQDSATELGPVEAAGGAVPTTGATAGTGGRTEPAGCI